MTPSFAALFPSDRHRAARLSGEPDAHSAEKTPRRSRTRNSSSASRTIRSRSSSWSSTRSSRSSRRSRTRTIPRSRSTTRRRSRRSISSAGWAEQRRVRLEGRRLFCVVGDPRHVPAARPADPLLALHHEPGPGRRLEGDELREEPRQAHVSGLAESDVQGRRRL